MDTVHKQEFRVRDLPTRSVTLFPSRAQVVRDIKDVVLKPGTNQVTVVGFSPTVDENSIKVEGTGVAIISDIAVELLPNREIFEDIYPETDEESEASEDDEDDEDDDIEDEPELQAVTRELLALRIKVEAAEEQLANAKSRLGYLDKYGSMLDRKRGIDIGAGLDTYQAERAKLYDDQVAAHAQLRELHKTIKKLGKDEARLERKKAKDAAHRARAKARASRARAKVREAAARRRSEAMNEKRRVRAERAKHWPRLCYTVRITLDAPSFTPASSRRGSVAIMATTVELAKPLAADGGDGDGEAAVDGSEASGPTCDLSISYVTSSAFWSPSYDLQLSTTSNTGLLCFDAKLTNQTSEAWAACKIILSTSQTTFSGLGDAIPALVPWRVMLAKGGGDGGFSSFKGSSSSHAYDSLLQSREEVSQKTAWQTQQNAAVLKQKPHSVLFGVGRPPPALPPPVPRPAAPTFAASSMARPAAPVPMVGRAPAPLAMVHAGTMRYRKVAGAAPPSDEDGDEDEDADGDGLGGLAADAQTLLPEGSPELAFQESSFEETGMTTTYDLPGLKTLAPAATATKQRVARVSFQNVAFSHTVVAKYKPAAYLQAKLFNASKLTLLRGPAGLTLDGAFLGRTTLPRCSAGGEAFTLSLGVDPAIRVAYPKPDVKRATTGLFSKEDSSAYKRSITVSNTRGGAAPAGTANPAGPAAAGSSKPARLLVLDQVPVSEDERLRVELQQPRGLAVGGPAVAAGVPVSAAGAPLAAGSAAAQDWGAARATLKKGGEVAWEVKLQAGRTVRLDLEYAVGAPTGDVVVQC